MCVKEPVPLQHSFVFVVGADEQDGIGVPEGQPDVLHDDEAWVGRAEEALQELEAQV